MCIEKAEKAYKTYEPETIGYCKNILESICKSVLEEKNQTYSDKESVQNLVGKTFGLFNLNSQISSSLANIIGGCSQIAKGSISRDEIEYDSEPENASTTNATIWYKANFNFDYDNQTSDGTFNLISLAFEGSNGNFV